MPVVYLKVPARIYQLPQEEAEAVGPLPTASGGPSELAPIGRDGADGAGAVPGAPAAALDLGATMSISCASTGGITGDSSAVVGVGPSTVAASEVVVLDGRASITASSGTTVTGSSSGSYASKSPVKTLLKLPSSQSQIDPAKFTNTLSFSLSHIASIGTPRMHSPGSLSPSRRRRRVFSFGSVTSSTTIVESAYLHSELLRQYLSQEDFYELVSSMSALVQKRIKVKYWLSRLLIACPITFGICLLILTELHVWPFLFLSLGIFILVWGPVFCWFALMRLLHSSKRDSEQGLQKLRERFRNSSLDILSEDTFAFFTPDPIDRTCDVNKLVITRIAEVKREMIMKITRQGVMTCCYSKQFQDVISETEFLKTKQGIDRFLRRSFYIVLSNILFHMSWWGSIILPILGFIASEFLGKLMPLILCAVIAFVLLTVGLRLSKRFEVVGLYEFSQSHLVEIREQFMKSDVNVSFRKGTIRFYTADQFISTSVENSILV